MKAPRGGLRPLHNRTNSVAKVELRVPAGGTVEVQADVAAQLLASGAFSEGAAPAGLLDAIDSAHAAPTSDQDLQAGAAPAEGGAETSTKRARPRKA